MKLDPNRDYAPLNKRQIVWLHVIKYEYIATKYNKNHWDNVYCDSGVDVRIFSHGSDDPLSKIYS